MYNSDVTVYIPIVYEIQEDRNREMYKCAVELTESEIPKWLTVTRFDIPKITIENVIVTQCSVITGIKSIDTALFIATVEQAISIAEMVQ